MTSTAYYPTITWYYYNATGAAWVDISGYVLTKQGVSGHWGMRSNKYTDRLAATGEMRMLLDNADGVFDPDDANVLTGWAINAKVKMVVTFDGVNYTRFYGKVDTLKFSDPSTYEHTAQVVVSDWMGYAYKKTLTDRSIETFKRGGYAFGQLVSATGQTPLATNYAVGDYEFPAINDSITTTTKVATEMNKIVLSENGYFYNRHDKVNGETVTFEAESTRNGLRTVSKLPKLAADCGDVLMAGSATDHVLMAGSATDKVVMNETQDAHINGTAQAYQRTHGENILNRVTVTAYPKRVDTSEQTIYSLGTPIVLAPGETKTVNVKYQNATTKESCNAITELCSQPVATTDYLMNRNKAGTSTNITANLTVSVVFHTASADVTFTSSSAYTGYVTRLYLKGYGVYQDASIRAEASDATSITAYGDYELNIEQQYQRDSAMGEGLAAKILAMEKDPRTKLEKVTLIANTSSVHMLAFLNVDIGDMVKITESDLNLADYYYVNGIEFSVAEGDVFTYSWVLNKQTSYSDISLDFSGDESYIKFIHTDKIIENPEKTIIMTLSLGNVTSGVDGGFITGLYVSGERGWFVSRLSTNKIRFLHTVGNINYWVTDTATLADDTSYRLAITLTTDWTDAELRVESALAIKKPLIYIDGVAAATSYNTGGSGSWDNDQSNLPFIVGLHGFGVSTGSRSNVLAYNRRLTADEITADAATPGCIKDGLVFAAPSVVTDKLASYDNALLTSSLPIFDRVGNTVATFTGSVTSQLIA
jgi:hypothetical protein